MWPLVLILGQNGCGKTTIIECLKYVTTGDAPPGSSAGKSFVHDPKMASEARVVGNVKLRFRAVNGKSYLISRSMEATQKTKTLSKKSLDGTIKDLQSGVSLTSKCADLDEKILDYMGVSKPILNYVIFCHQEDSNWPLDEGGKVKDKFDEIFASAKYKDCLKKIQGVRKEHKIEEKKDKAVLEHLSDAKKDAKNLKREIRIKGAERENLAQELEEINRELDPIKEKIRSMREAEVNFGGVKEKRNKAAINLDNAREAIEELREKLKDFAEKEKTDDEIQRTKARMVKEKGFKARDIESKAREIRELAEGLREQQGKKNSLAAALGELSTRQRQFADMQGEFAQKVADTGDQFGLDDVAEDVAANEDEIDRVMRLVAKAVATAMKKVRR